MEDTMQYKEPCGSDHGPGYVDDSKAGNTSFLNRHQIMTLWQIEGAAEQEFCKQKKSHILK